MSWVVGIAAGVIGILAVCVPMFVLPAVGAQTAEQIERAIDRHTQHPHPGGMTPSEKALILGRFDRIERLLEGR